MEVKTKKGAIFSVDDWCACAPPKHEEQWLEGRSAYELAYAWCGTGRPAMPPEIRQVLDLLPDGQGLSVETVHPEHQIRIDGRSGEPRNADLAFVATSGERRVAVTVEAKADEPFGSTVAQTMAAALERAVSNPRSDGLGRVRELARSLFMPSEPKQKLPKIGSLHYQLLTATAGSLAYAEAEGADAAMLVVHEFRTSRTNDDLHKANGNAFARFIARLSGQSEVPLAAAPFVVGPFRVGREGGRWHQIPLHIGETVVDRR